MNNAELFNKWHNGVHLFQVAHHMAAAYYSRRHRLLGVPVVVLSTIVGTSIFASLQTEVHFAFKIVAGMFSVGAGVFAALQTFLGYEGLSEKHKIAAAKYSELRRDIQQVITVPPADDGKFVAFCEAFRTRWAAVDRESPTIPQNIHNAAESFIASKP
jgi:hypothetical protein